MTELLPQITAGVSAALSWVGTVASTITATPLLLTGIVLSFVGIGVGLFKNLFAR